jgi:signal transduction histidine kinase
VWTVLTRVDRLLDGFFPEADNEADTRRQRFIGLLALLTMPLCLVGVAHEAWVDNPIGVAINAAMVVLNIAVVEAIRRGFGRYVAWPMVLLTLVFSNLAAAMVGGAQGAGFAGNFVVVVFAMIVLPRWSLLIVVPLQTLAAWLMFHYPMQQIVVFDENMALWQWFVCLSLSGGMVAALVTVTESLLDRANEKSDALEGALTALQQTSVSRDFVEGVLATVPEFVAVTDFDGRIRLVNRTFSTEAGWTDEQLVGEPLQSVFPGLDLGRPASEAMLLCHSGERIPVQLARGDSPILSSDGELLQVWSATDIRAQHATANALRQAHQRAQSASLAKSNFLASMSHELRTPLNAIIGYGELLADELDDDDQLRDLDRIGSAARTLLDLINGVLDLSRVESGKMELQLDHTPLADIVDPVLNLLEPITDRRGLELRAEAIDREGALVYTDAGKLRQVLTNLLTNAAKFTNEGRVELRATRWARSGLDWLRFEVLDTGVGMEPADLERVFEPFAQVDESRGSALGGTGLGLSISRAFVEMMGGQIYAESTPGRGSRFVVEVPAARTSRIRTTPTPSGPLPGARDDSQTILVVDDDEAFLELVNRVLASDERQVICTPDPHEGLAWASANVADLILLDVEMPGVNGWSFMVRLRDTSCAGTPVIVISGDGDEDVGRALGALQHLKKPIQNTALREAVDQVLAEPAA